MPKINKPWEGKWGTQEIIAQGPVSKGDSSNRNSRKKAEKKHGEDIIKQTLQENFL